MRATPRQFDAPTVDFSHPLRGGASFGLRNRLYRGAFAVTWLLLCRWTPRPLRRWRGTILRIFGADVALTANVYGSAVIWSPANLTVGDYACIGPGAIIYSMAPVVLERHALVSQRAHLCAGGHDVDDPNFPLRAETIRICEQAWVAAEAYVGPGVIVGAGAVLGARGCAAKDLDPWTIYVGNPARAVRRRKIRDGGAPTSSRGEP